MKQYRYLLGWSTRFLWQSSAKDVVGYCVFIAVQVISEVAQLWLAALIVAEIGKIFLTQGSGEYVLLLAILSIVLMTIDKIAWQILGFFERRIYLYASANTYLMFNNKLAELSISQHNDTEIRQMVDRIEYEGYMWKPINFSMELLYTLHAFIRFVVSSIVIFTVLPLVVLLLFIGVLPMLYVQSKSGDAGWGIWGDIGDGSRVFWGITHILRRREGIEEVKPQQSSSFLLNKAFATIRDYTARAIKVRNKYTKYEASASVFEMLLAGLSYLWLVWKAIGGGLSFERFIFTSTLIWQTLSSIRLVTTSIGRAIMIVPFMNDFTTFLSMKNSLPLRGEPIIPDGQGLTIELRNVNFSYPESDSPQINDVSFTINDGDHIALVGENGAGKTTLIRLLLRFYDPDAGSILVNGVDLRDIDLDWYYSKVGSLFQSFNHYPLSYRDNITLTDKVDTQRYKATLELSGADKVLDTIGSDARMLGQGFTKGADLSGGQWQKVAIARNMYRNADLYILDEPTSAIDAIAEQQIFNKLFKEFSNKTLITVSHRFNTVRKAGTILVLENGKIVEVGSHEELCEQKNSLYYTMFSAQAEGYK